MTEQPTDRDPIRQARLDSLGVLLTRITNGLTLTQDEARLLVEHVGTEVRDGTTARELASAAAAADSAEAERDRLRAAILDIDAHATPIGLADRNDPDGNPHHYAVTVGALHRALGKVGHTAAPCTAEGTISRVTSLYERWAKAGPPPLGTLMARWWDKRLAELHAALDRPTDTATDSRAHIAEAVRQMDADPTQPHTGAVVQPYRENGVEKWVFRCWGSDTCDGWLSLDHTSKEWAERARDRHLAEDHKEQH